MHSDMIGKIEKARRYAKEPERITFDKLTACFHGGNSEHKITLTDGNWQCDCSFFHQWGTCAHIMATQKLLDPMLPATAREPGISIDMASENHIENDSVAA